MENNELQWNFFELNIKLYEKYLDLLVKINAYYFALVGAMLSYCLAHSRESNVKFAMLLPMVMGGSLILIYCKAIPRVKTLREDVVKTSSKLDFESHPEVDVLKWFLIASIVVKSITVVGLVMWVFGIQLCFH